MLSCHDACTLAPGPAFCTSDGCLGLLAGPLPAAKPSMLQRRRRQLIPPLLTGRRYDIPSLEDINTKEDAEGLHASFKYVEGLVAEQVRAGIDSTRIGKDTWE